jgi:hypothetical protein
MRKFIIAAVVMLSAALGAEMADAQVRIKPRMQNYGGQNIIVPRVNKMPRVPNIQVKPKINILPPSAALKRAMGAMPNSKPLGLKLRNQTYIVRLKSGGTITEVGVNSQTGAITGIQ